jgi:hypothetical protein
MRKTSANELLMTHRNPSDDIETREGDCPGKSMAETCLLAMRCPVYRQRESHLGFCTELENLAGDGKGKSTSGRTVRLKVPTRQSGADCSVVAMKRVMAVERRGQATRAGIHWSTGNGRSLRVSAEGGSLRWVARAG